MALGERTIDILGVGNLIPLKAYDQWLSIVAELVKGGKVSRAVLIGNGPEKESLQNMIRQMGMQDQIQLPGALPREEVLGYMSESKVFLHTSTYESFGFVLVEAAAHGAEVVSRPVGIAFGSSWRLASDRLGFIQQLESALAYQAERAQDRLFPLRDTVEQYVDLYDS